MQRVAIPPTSLKTHTHAFLFYCIQHNTGQLSSQIFYEWTLWYRLEMSISEQNKKTYRWTKHVMFSLQIGDWMNNNCSIYGWEASEGSHWFTSFGNLEVMRSVGEWAIEMSRLPCIINCDLGINVNYLELPD